MLSAICPPMMFFFWHCVEIAQNRRRTQCTEHVSKKIRPSKGLALYFLQKRVCGEGMCQRTRPPEVPVVWGQCSTCQAQETTQDWDGSVLEDRWGSKTTLALGRDVIGEVCLPP